jgi:hypothetical protein
MARVYYTRRGRRPRPIWHNLRVNAPSRSKRWRRALAALAALYALFALAAWLAVPWAVRRALREVPKNLPGFDARIAEARFNPFKLALTVRGFALSHEKLGDLATCDEFYASVQPLDLLRLAVGLRELRLTRPRLVAVIAADGSSALSELPKSAPASPAPAKASAPFIPRLVIHRFTIERAALEFESRLPSAPQRLVADPIDLALENLSTLPDDKGSYAFSARTNRGETLAWNGQLSVRPPKLSGHVAAEGVDLSRETTAAPAAPVVIASGRLDASTDYEFSYADGALSAALTDGRLSVRDMMWNLRGSTAPARGPFALAVGPARVSARAPLPAAPGAKTTLTVETLVDGRGSVKLEASLAASPLTGGASLSVKDFPLAPFTPLGPPPTQVVVDSGSVSLDVKAALAPGGTADVEAGLSLDGFSLSDRASRRALVKLGRFAVSGARASTKTRTASIDRVSLERPTLRLFRGKDGLTNVEAALGVSFSSMSAAAPAASTAAASAAAPARPAAPAWRASLKRFSMSGGRTIVQDEAVAPAFALSVHDVSAELKNLTTDGRSTAAFESKGMVEAATFSVSGDVRLSSAAAWVNAKIKTDGVQLSAFTPYSIQVIGYKLDKGTLNLDLDEGLAVRRVQSRNKILVDQLTLGDKVDSPTAIKAPVKLGLAILKDRRGVIDLDVPIAGSLDDPQFRLLPVVLKTLVNLIIKAATSPFDALSSALGGGADLGHVAFAPGASALAPASSASLDKVVQALVDRPSLSVGVRGAAGKADALGLGDVALRRRLRGPDAGDAALTPAEQKKTLALYAKQFGAEAASPDEARAKLDESLAAGDADLRALALARVSAIQAYLTAKGLDPKRFFSLEPAASAKTDGAAPCELQLDAR